MVCGVVVSGVCVHGGELCVLRFPVAFLGRGVCLSLCGVSAALRIVLPVLAWCTAAPGRGVQKIWRSYENPTPHAPHTHGKFSNPIFVHRGFIKMQNQIFFTQR